MEVRIIINRWRYANSHSQRKVTHSFKSFLKNFEKSVDTKPCRWYYK